VALLFTGLTYGYDSFWNPRSLAVRPYNNAVDRWNTGERQHLEESQFYFRAYSPRAVKVTVPAVTCTAGDTECTPAPAHEETKFEEVEPTDAYADTVAWVSPPLSLSLARALSLSVCLTLSRSRSLLTTCRQ